jgi:hypothetical protein
MLDESSGVVFEYFLSQLLINAHTNTLGMLMALESIESKYWITVFKIVIGKMPE